MCEDLITEITQAVVDKTIAGNLEFYGLLFIVTLLSTAISSFVVSYLRKRGESYATKMDFDEILRQLKESTEATEKIRSEVVSQFSMEEERRRVLRSKLEEVVEQSFALELWLEQARSDAVNGETFNINSSPLSNIETIISIYFSSTDDVLVPIKESTTAMMEWMLRLHVEHWRAKKTATTPEYSSNEFSELYPAVRDALTSCRDRLISENRDQLGL